MIEALQYEFMRNALAAGLLASVACGVVGSLVAVNRIVFLAGAVAHAAYGGVGLAFFMGWPVMPCAMGFALGAGGGMAALTREGMEGSDTAIGTLWALGMATGVILLDFTPGYHADLMSFLFGSLLSVPVMDLWLMLGLDAAVLALTAWFYKDFLAMSYDREFAASRGVPVAGLHFLLLAMTAISVVMIIRVVGLILVIALLSIPTSLAARRATSLWGMMAGATVLSAVFCVAGLWAAYAFDVTSGAAVTAVAGLGYVGTALWSRLFERGG